MLPLFKVGVNEPISSVHSNYPGHSWAYPVPVSCRFRQKKARRLTDPLGAQTLRVCPIAKNAGDANQLFKKALRAKDLSRIEAPWGTPNDELERRR